MSGRAGDPVAKLMEVGAAAEVDRDANPDWRPPEGSHTFANYTLSQARELLRFSVRRREVVIRGGGPMFGRHGYAKSVIADSKDGFLVLVIAYVAEKRRGSWIEPFKPKPEERAFWRPGEVELG